MAVALTFGTVILDVHSQRRGDAVCVGSDLNGFGMDAVLFCLVLQLLSGCSHWRCILQEEKTFFQAI